MKKAIMLLLVLMFSATLLYAGSGDLIVNGMIGAGNTSPNYSLDVIGDVNITGTYRINGVSLPSALTGAVSGLTITYDATNPNTKIDVTANVIGTVVPSGAIGIDCTTSGQPAGNDLDAGTLAANTWYYIWVIYNGTTIAGLASTSRTSPTMPANYTTAYQRLIGVAKTDPSYPISSRSCSREITSYMTQVWVSQAGRRSRTGQSRTVRSISHRYQQGGRSRSALSTNVVSHQCLPSQEWFNLRRSLNGHCWRSR